MLHAVLSTPVGELVIVTDANLLHGVYRRGQQHFPADIGEPDDAAALGARAQLREYFAGTRRQFDLPLAARGTDFQRRVWGHLRDHVPYGTTTTYGAIAAALGMPRAAQAVGAAVGHNPWSIVVGCHRVLGASGSLTGYAGGLAMKQALLEWEKSHRA